MRRGLERVEEERKRWEKPAAGTKAARLSPKPRPGKAPHRAGARGESDSRAVLATNMRSHKQPSCAQLFGVDKIQHFFISAFIERSHTARAGGQCQTSTGMAGAIGVTAGIGVARELHDRRKPGNDSAIGISRGRARDWSSAVLLTNTRKYPNRRLP